MYNKNNLLYIVYIMSYKFNTNWFNSSELKKGILKYFTGNKKIKILEIGSYEGASACYLSDNLLNHNESKLVCVDPFDVDDKTTPVNESTKELFLQNISKSKNYEKIDFKHMFSNDFFKQNNEKFDLIYIDGSHLEEDISLDFRECLKIINEDGIIWMDDYGGGEGGYIKKCIDKLYEENKYKVYIIHKGYQIAFKLNKKVQTHLS
jgi:hypothetical protein